MNIDIFKPFTDKYEQALDKLLPHPLDQYPEIDLLGHEYITGDTVLLFSGPPTLQGAINNKNKINCIGLGNSITINSNRGITPAVELNMKHEYFIPGRINSSINFGRILTSHNNIMYALYKWLWDYLKNNYGGNLSFLENAGGLLNNSTTNHFNGFSSDLFLAPFGLLIVEFDMIENYVSGVYAENCKTLTLSKSISESPVVIENVNIQTQVILPIDDSLMPKFTEANSYNYILKRDETSTPSNNINNNQLASNNIVGFTNTDTATTNQALNDAWNNLQNTVFPERRLSGFDTEQQPDNIA